MPKIVLLPEPAPELPWGDPDMTVLQSSRRPPPSLPLDVFGAEWRAWIERAAEASAAPPDYVVAPFLAGASNLIGNARWAQAAPGWAEPPHLWTANVGDSGDGKSPGADPVIRNALPAIERRMSVDFPDKLREWETTREVHANKVESWKADVKQAQKKGFAPPLPPAECAQPPQAPRLVQSDVTIEKVASLLATAAPKGLLIVRDELTGWLKGMTAYNDSGRAFWVEAYGGRPFRVERQKSPVPIDVPHLVVAVTGGIQPDRLAELFNDPDDGLLSRFCWFWPERVPFRLATVAPNIRWAIEGMDRLRLLEMTVGDEGLAPVRVPLVPGACGMMEQLGWEMQQRQDLTRGLLRSAHGKARGLALRLSLVLEYLWWCARDGFVAPPTAISENAFAAAAIVVSDYLMPMAARVYGDAKASEAERNATTLAKWIVGTKAGEVHVRHLQREVRLPGLREAETICEACDHLAEADWLRAPKIGFGRERKVAYLVNPKVHRLNPKAHA